MIFQNIWTAPLGSVKALFSSSIGMKAIVLIVYPIFYINDATELHAAEKLDTIDIFCTKLAAMVQLKEK